MININECKEIIKNELEKMISDYLIRAKKNPDGHHEHINLINWLETIASLAAVGFQVAAVPGAVFCAGTGGIFSLGKEMHNYRKNHKRDTAGRIFRFFARSNTASAPDEKLLNNQLDHIINTIFFDRMNILYKIKDTDKNKKHISKFFAANIMKVIKRTEPISNTSLNDCGKIISDRLGIVRSRRIISRKLEMENSSEKLSSKDLALKHLR